MNPLLISKAIDTVTRATEEDKNKHYEEALKLYKEAILYFNQFIDGDDVPSETIKEELRSRVVQYSNRVNNIENYLKSCQTEEVTEVPVASISLISISFPFLQKAVEVVTRAVEEDKNHEYERALQSYDEAVQLFLHAIKYEAKTERVKEKIQKRIIEYEDRAAKIADYLKKMDTRKKTKMFTSLFGCCYPRKCRYEIMRLSNE
ncbi:hypothetical protein CHUAL_007514 [Chamberlinius hualienensis]